MKWLVILFALVSAAVASESHSIEKRTTTVTSDVWADVIIYGFQMFVVLVGLYLIFTALAPVYNKLAAENGGARKLAEQEMFSILDSIDMVDTTFNVMDVESEVCRKRAVCEVESVASSNPLFSLVVNTVNSNLRGLERYSDAVEAGLGGEDCALAYDECPHSFLAQLPTFF